MLNEKQIAERSGEDLVNIIKMLLTLIGGKTRLPQSFSQSVDSVKLTIDFTRLEGEPTMQLFLNRVQVVPGTTDQTKELT